MITKSILGVKKEFANNDELFAYVKSNLTQIIDAKKVEQYSCNKGQSVTCKVLNGTKLMVAEKAIAVDDNYWYIAVNSTRVLDSHDDLHMDGLWNTTVKDQQQKNYLVADHSLTIDSTIVKKEHIEMFVANVAFEALGYNYKGDTQVLVYKFPKTQVIHDKARYWLESGDEIQASVRMRYVTIEFALDSNSPEDEVFKKRYVEYIGKIANRQDFDYIPYFFIVKEAINQRESSLVLFGSNHVTGNIINTSADAEQEVKDDPSLTVDENKNRPAPEQSREKKSNFYNLIHN